MRSQEVSSPSFCLKQGHLKVNHRRLRFLSSCVFNICKAELLQVLDHPPVKKIYVCSEQLLLQSMLMVFCLPAVPQYASHHAPGDLLSGVGIGSLVWPKPSLFLCGQAQLPQPLFTGQMLQHPNIFTAAC